MAQGGHTIGEAACGVSFYNGLPVCAMRERVNRYAVIFLSMLLTSSLSYGKMRLGQKMILRGCYLAAPMGMRKDRVAAVWRWSGTAADSNARLGEGK